MPISFGGWEPPLFVQGTTDANGFFSIPLPGEDEIGEVGGMIASVQHKNGNWHTLDMSNLFTNRFWWTQTSVSGQIDSPDFANRPMKVIVFHYAPGA
jgi:hypothetical protein